MVETTKKRTLVELVLRKGNNSEDPKLCIATNNEVAESPVILSNIRVLRYSGPEFEKSDGSRDFKEDAIRDFAPRKANAYLIGSSLRNQAVMCSDVHTPIVYFRINEEQANRAPQPKKPYRFRTTDYGNYDDGSAD